MDTYPVLKAHPLPLPRHAEAKGREAKGEAKGGAQRTAPSRATVAQLEVYCLALANPNPNPNPTPNPNPNPNPTPNPNPNPNPTPNLRVDGESGLLER